jgi:2-methylisocitrate lyase-like PEP mutase family enzyme
VKQAARAAGVNVVLNARVDVFIREVGAPEDRLPFALRCANAYREAGADCIFPFGVTDEATISALVKGINGPVNIAMRAGGPTLKRLAELGVARVSFASQLAKLAVTDLERRLAAIRQGESI